MPLTCSISFTSFLLRRPAPATFLALMIDDGKEDLAEGIEGVEEDRPDADEDEGLGPPGGINAAACPFPPLCRAYAKPKHMKIKSNACFMMILAPTEEGGFCFSLPKDSSLGYQMVPPTCKCCEHAQS
jgi:hypothetical protein